MNFLEKHYKESCVPKLQDKFKYKNVHEIPKLEKIVINMGLGEAVQNPKIIESAVAEMTLFSGQKPVITRSKKSIAAFKLRENLPIGCCVTLRKNKMYDFMAKLIHIAIPRIRDFRGLSSKGFDGSGNYTLGLKEQIIFPEIDYDKVDKIKGMNITFVTTAKTNEESMFMLDIMGMPFRK